MDKLEVDTKLGWLFVEETPYTNEEYPGFWIGLKRGDTEITFLLVEVDQSADPPVLRIREWPIDKDGVWDDPVHYTDASSERVDEMFSKEE